MKLDRATNKDWWMPIAAGAFLAAAAIVAIKSRAPKKASELLGRYRRRATGDAWRFDHQFRRLAEGKPLRVEAASPAVVHWTVDQWDNVQDTRTHEVSEGVHVAELATGRLKPGARVQFTFFWPGVNRWEGEDFELRIAPSGAAAAQTAEETA